MTDLPERLLITEEGPRESFQIEPGPIPTADKIRLIEALSRTGVAAIQACSFVSPRRVPGWADADAVIDGLSARPGVDYTALWFDDRGLRRALAHRDVLTLTGTIHTVASEAFCRRNLNRDLVENATAMEAQTRAHLDAGIEVSKVSVMAAFGCNFAGDVPVSDALAAVETGLGIAARHGCRIAEVALCDTMGWANPSSVRRVVGEVRERWPERPLRLHLHDTRGLGIANASAALECGVDRFDTAVGGLGGCPFAGPSRPRAAPSTATALPPGNIATEELVLLAAEMGIETGIDLDALLAAGALAEEIVGRALPSAALRGGHLDAYRRRARA